VRERLRPADGEAITGLVQDAFQASVKRRLATCGRLHQGQEWMIRDEWLPAVPAVSTVTAATPATAAMTTAATTTAAATPAVTSTPATTTSATAAALGLRPGFIDDEVPPAEILAVQGVDGAIGVFVALHLDEGETARLARKAVTNEIDTRGSNAYLREPFLKLLFRRGKRKIADVELLHLPTPSARNPSKSRGAR